MAMALMTIHSVLEASRGDEMIVFKRRLVAPAAQEIEAKRAQWAKDRPHAMATR